MKGVYIITKNKNGESIRGETVSVSSVTRVVKEILANGQYAEIHKL